MDKYKTITIITLGLIVFCILAVIISMAAAGLGYAPCAWYNFEMNDTLAREVMETCLK